MQMREASMMREVQAALIKLGLDAFCVTSVRVSPDWKHSNVYFIQTGQDEEDLHMSKMLNNRLHEIAGLVKNRCSGHFFPKFRFIFDSSALQNLRVEQLLLGMPDQNIED